MATYMPSPGQFRGADADPEATLELFTDYLENTEKVFRVSRGYNPVTGAKVGWTSDEKKAILQVLVETVSRLQSKVKKTDTAKKKGCEKCGIGKCTGGDSCFAQGKSCNTCRTTGHFAASKLCKDKGKEKDVSKAGKGKLDVSKAAKEKSDVVTEAISIGSNSKDIASKEQVDVSKAAKRRVDVSKAAKEKSDVVTKAIRIGSNSKDILGRIITVSKVKKEKKKTKGKSDVVTEAGKEKVDVSKAGKGRVDKSKAAKERFDVVTEAGRKPEDNNVAKVKMAAMEDDRHECSIRPITDTGVKKTILCRSDWAKIARYGQVLKTSTRFRPYGTSVQLPIRGKAKVYLKAQAGAVIATYV